MIRRILMVASREFTTTVARKGFIVGVLLGPLFTLLVVTMIPRILNSRTPQVVGDVAVYDPTASTIPGLRTAFDPTTIAAARKALRAGGGAPQPIPGLAAIPRLTVVPRDADVKAGKAWLMQDEHHLALVMVHPDAVVHPEGAANFGTYDLYVSPRLDEGTELTIIEGVRQALVASRLKSSGLDQALVEAAMRVARPNSVIVAAAGEHSAQRGIARMLPFIFGVLLFIGVFVGAQTLMASTVEEKSSRVIEVLLAAVSPVELMWGKLIGQLGVGLIMMGAYLALGLSALAQFALFGVLDPMLVVYLVVFYLVAYLVYGALMLAVGAAVSQIADAQSLLAPIMLLLVGP